MALSQENPCHTGRVRLAVLRAGLGLGQGSGGPARLFCLTGSDRLWGPVRVRDSRPLAVERWLGLGHLGRSSLVNGV